MAPISSSYLRLTLALTVTLNAVTATYFEGLDDSLIHKIVWEGPLLEGRDSTDDGEFVQMKTVRNEEYHCILPKLQEQHNLTDEANKPYTGPNPLDLLGSLFNQFICTFKLETYWTYELCHGKYIRQYHEERDGKKVKLQEYYLGRWDKEDLFKAKLQIESDFANPSSNQKGERVIPTKRVDGIMKPVLQLNMSDGTHCELNGLPRSTKVLYVCDPHGKHEIHSLEEVSTCEYEIIVLSPLLCQHPDFKTKDTSETLIKCYSLNGAPVRPSKMTELDEESLKLRHEHLLQNLESLLETKIKTDGFSRIDLNDEKPLKYNGGTGADNSFLYSFFSGKECLNGGSHWWRVEFCFNKHVLQYHEEESSKSRTEIMLGKWDPVQHKEWLEQNPQRKPTPKTVYHFYSDGDSCDGRPRTVQVKFRCVEHPSPSAVTLYLLEPKTCEYTLSVESALFCTVINKSDADGLFDITQFLKSRKSSSSSSSTGTKTKTRAIVIEDQEDVIILANNDDDA